MSALLQACVVALLFTALSNRVVQQKVRQAVTLVMPLDLAPSAPPKAVSKGGGGGGDRSLLPASKGRLPKAAVRQFVPPCACSQRGPAGTMEAAILAPPDVVLPNVNMPNYGDPGRARSGRRPTVPGRVAASAAARAAAWAPVAAEVWARVMAADSAAGYTASAGASPGRSRFIRPSPSIPTKGGARGCKAR